MKIYHFLPEQWALKALKTQRLKVSSYDSLNDPFELLAMSLEDKTSQSRMSNAKSRINERLRILCCSKRWVSPLLWGHYADKHKGIALELEVSESALSPITYVKDRPPFDLPALKESHDVKALHKLLSTKYVQWSYEEEVRVGFEKEDFFCDGDMDFYKLGGEIKIVGMVLGHLNETKQADIENNLPEGMEIDITLAKIALNTFDVVHHKTWRVHNVSASRPLSS